MESNTTVTTTSGNSTVTALTGTAGTFAFNLVLVFRTQVQLFAQHKPELQQLL
jgi:hypothetical protein